MSDITHLPTRAEFIRDHIAERMTWAGLNAGSGWLPEPADTGVMHGPLNQGDALLFALRPDWSGVTDGIVGEGRWRGHRVPGTTRTV